MKYMMTAALVMVLTSVSQAGTQWRTYDCGKLPITGYDGDMNDRATSKFSDESYLVQVSSDNKRAVLTIRQRNRADQRTEMDQVPSYEYPVFNSAGHWGMVRVDLHYVKKITDLASEDTQEMQSKFQPHGHSMLTYRVIAL